jgi:hypothetical protein
VGELHAQRRPARDLFLLFTGRDKATAAETVTINILLELSNTGNTGNSRYEVPYLIFCFSSSIAASFFLMPLMSLSTSALVCFGASYCNNRIISV